MKDGDHLSSPDVTIRVKRPTRGLDRASFRPSIWSCSGWGLPSRLVTQPLVSSYLTISPLSFSWRTVCFCGTFR